MRSYHLWTEDWPSHYTYDPQAPPLWDAACAFGGANAVCPPGDEDLIPFTEPEDPSKLLQAHRVCLDHAYGADRWTRAEIPYDN